MRGLQTFKDLPKDRYFWKEEAEKIPGFLRARRRQYFEQLEAKGVLARVERNLIYYYGDRYPDTYSEMALKMGGEQGEIVLAQFAEFRAFIRLLITYVIQSPPALDTIVLNYDVQSANDAILGNQLLDYYTETERATELFFRLVETALIYTAGYIFCCWDPLKGNPMQANPQTNEIFYDGDVEFENLTLFDVFYDVGITTYSKNPWICCRKRRLKWDVLEEYGGMEQEINQNIEKDRDETELEIMASVGQEYTDQIWVNYAYHLPVPCLPKGREIIYVGDAVMKDGPWKMKLLPLVRMIPEEVVGSADGYTSAFDLQGLQEAIDMEVSTILTDHNALGGKKVWFSDNDAINVAELEPGIKVVQSETPPQVLSFSGGNAENLKMIEVLIRGMENMTGMNPTARGTIEPGIKSGVALSITEARATQFTSNVVKNFDQAHQDWGAVLLKLLQMHAGGKRQFSILGVNNERHTREFSKDDISSIERVAVKPSPAAMRTLAGRVQIATALLETGLIREPEAFLDVVQTGDLSKLTAMSMAQRKIIARENEELLRGQPVEVNLFDNHPEHMRAHSSLFDHPETRSNPVLFPMILAHMQQHTEIMISPQGKMAMIELGYQIPEMLMGITGPSSGGGQKQPKQAGVTGAPMAGALAGPGEGPGSPVPPGGNPQ